MTSITLLFTSHIFNLLVKLHVALKTLHKCKEFWYRRKFLKRCWKKWPQRQISRRICRKEQKNEPKADEVYKTPFLFKMKKKEIWHKASERRFQKWRGFLWIESSISQQTRNRQSKPCIILSSERTIMCPWQKTSNEHRYRFCETRNEIYFQLVDNMAEA